MDKHNKRQASLVTFFTKRNKTEDTQTTQKIKEAEQKAGDISDACHKSSLSTFHCDGTGSANDIANFVNKSKQVRNNTRLYFCPWLSGR